MDHCRGGPRRTRRGCGLPGLAQRLFPVQCHEGDGSARHQSGVRQRDLGAKLDAATQTAAGLDQKITAVGEQIKTATAPLADLSGRVDGLDQRIASAEEALTAAKSDLDQFRKTLSAGTDTGATTGTPVDNAALAALAQRIDALEKDVASLKSSKGSGDASVTAALSQALADLKAKIAAGTGFADEYDRIARMVPAPHPAST